METLDVSDSQSEEVFLGVTTHDSGPGTWLGGHALNDTECLLAPEGSLDCQPNATLALASSPSNATLPLAGTNSTALPPSLGFDDNALTDIIIYSVMFVVAAVGNLTVFITLFRNRHRKSRVNLMIMHLAAADLMVTLINFPLEVGWRITTQWVAGNLACKLFQFLRAFGLYLSSLVLVCISLDRYFAIVHPLKVNDAQRRGKIMLSFAWSTAAVCSLPQSVIFHVDTHPVFKNFRQCVTFGFFRTQVEEMTYNLFCLAAMYFLPLFIIIVVYLRILWEISQKSKDSKEDASNSRGRNGRMRLRRSDMTNIERARARTLRMTVIIVLAFIWCWTPYVVIVMWYMFDRQSAEQVDKRLQDALFIMAVSNSCVNPLVYGTYTINFRNELNRCFGRKVKPPVLARKSTVMTSQEARTTKCQVRSSVTTLDPVQRQGSTAMRTTVTAQLCSGSCVRMSTHTQVVHREGSARAAGRRMTPTESRSSPPSKTCHPPLASSKFSTSSTPPGSTSCPDGAQSSAIAPPSSTSASGCVMVEIEVDVDGQTPETHLTSSQHDISTPRSPGNATKEGSSVDDRSFAYPQSEEQTQENSTDGVKLASLFPSSYEKGTQGSCPDGVKLTAFLQTGGSPAPLSKLPKDTEAKDPFLLDRKLSVDSGVFFDNRHKRLQQSSLGDITSDHSEATANGRQATDMELQRVRPLDNML